MFVATIVATDTLAHGDIDEAADRVRDTGASVDRRAMLDADFAADIFFTGDAKAVRATLQAMEGGIDVIVQPAATRAKKLLVADMDSTMILIECIASPIRNPGALR